jgi:hypothetical protein
MKGKQWDLGMKAHIGIDASADVIRHWSYDQASPECPKKDDQADALVAATK